MTDILIIAATVLILAAAATYVIRSKKRGQTCIGCPHSKTCSGNCCGCDQK